MGASPNHDFFDSCWSLTRGRGTGGDGGGADSTGCRLGPGLGYDPTERGSDGALPRHVRHGLSRTGNGCIRPRRRRRAAARRRGRPPGSPTGPDLLAEAERFLALFHAENPAAGSPTERIRQMRREIEAEGTYRHTSCGADLRGPGGLAQQLAVHRPAVLAEPAHCVTGATAQLGGQRSPTESVRAPARSHQRRPDQAADHDLRP